MSQYWKTGSIFILQGGWQREKLINSHWYNACCQVSISSVYELNSLSKETELQWPYPQYTKNNIIVMQKTSTICLIIYKLDTMRWILNSERLMWDKKKHYDWSVFYNGIWRVRKWINEVCTNLEPAVVKNYACCL